MGLETGTKIGTRWAHNKNKGRGRDKKRDRDKVGTRSRGKIGHTRTFLGTIWGKAGMK